MGKWVADHVLDSALAVVAQADKMLAVSGQPANYAAANSTRLAEVSLQEEDFEIEAGDSSGRKIVVGAKLGIPVLVDGTADHVALVDSVTSQLLYVTTCPSQLLASSGTVSFDPWTVEIGAPV